MIDGQQKYQRHNFNRDQFPKNRELYGRCFAGHIAQLRNHAVSYQGDQGTGQDDDKKVHAHKNETGNEYILVNNLSPLPSKQLEYNQNRNNGNGLDKNKHHDHPHKNL